MLILEWARAAGRHAVVGACLSLAAGLSCAASGPMDFLFTSDGVPTSESAGPNPRLWKYTDYSALRLTPREAGSPANSQPVQVGSEALRVALATVEVTLGPDRVKPLFSSSELGDLVPTLARALAAAGPGDDLLLLSTARREAGLLSFPTSITARLFWLDGALHLIVHEARADYYSSSRMTKVMPNIQFPSRQAASRTAIRSSVAASRRGDWVALDLRAGMAALANTGVAPNYVPAAPAAPSAAPRAAEPAAPVPASRNRDAAFYDEQEQRLRGLKRLRDQGLISDAEYEQKRRDVLQGL